MDLAELLRRERRRQGWTQADLAHQLGDVEQQTVSRWERGVSRPRAELVSRLGQVLGVPQREIAAAIGYLPQDEGDSGRALARPLSRSLPLLELPADRFEGFCKDFFRLLRGTPDVHRYGGQGHRQDGIDLVVRLPDGSTEVVQCKRHKRFGPAKVREAIEATRVEADQYVLVLARDTASPGARDEIRKHEGWKLWDAEDIADSIRYELDTADAVRLVDTYFPGSRESFLGMPKPGPWVLPDEYFRPFQSSAVYHHERQLVGRHEVLRDATDWADAPDFSPVALVVGRGGIGKTRLLRELADVFQDEADLRVRFLATGMGVTPDSLEGLPQDRLVLVIDDAHDRPDLPGILQGVIRERPQSRVVLALRPYGLASFDPALRAIGLRRRDVPVWELDDLELEDAELLARSIVGDSRRIGRLAALTRDCPLITVLGAELVRRGSLDPTRIDAATDIRSEILTAFREALTGEGPYGPNELRRSVLDLVALLQPLRTDSQEFREVLTVAVDATWDRVVRELRDLEAAGVLLRRGHSLRIVPDLLGDAILADAAFDPAGNTTGLVERVITSAAGVGEPRQHAFINMIRVDWQVRERRVAASSPADLIWRALREEFRQAGIRDRKRLLQLVARVSAFAPAESMDLVRWAMSNPTDVVEELDHPYAALLGDVDYSDVLQELPPVLRGVAYTFGHLADVCDLLWSLAAEDDRPPNQHPQHPLRVLQDLAEYQQGKPSAYNEVVLERAAHWLENGPTSDFHSPFDVLDPLLATEGADRRWTETAVTFQPFALRLEAVLPLRNQVIDLALREIVRSDLNRAVRAAQTIENGLRGPTGIFGRPVSEDEQQRWDNVFIETLARIENGLAGVDLDPVVWSAIREALSWHLTWSETSTREAATRVMALAPSSLDRDLTEALLDSWGRRFERRDSDYTEIESRLETHNQALAQKLCSERTADDVVEMLEDRLEAISKGLPGKQDQAGRFVWRLCRECAGVALSICRRVLAEPASPSTTVLSAALGAMAEEQNPQTVKIARSLGASGSSEIVRRTAHAFGWGRGSRSKLLDGELEMLHELAVHEDASVRRAVARAAQVLSESIPGDAMDLLLSIPFSDSESVAEEVLGTFARQEAVSWSGLNMRQREMLLSQLVEAPSLDDYKLHAALAELSAIHPTEVLGLLFSRAERMEVGYADDYRPLPFQWNPTLQFRKHSDFPTHLRIVRDWIASRTGSGWRQQLGPDIFWTVALKCDREVELMLLESVEDADPDVVKATGTILRGAPRQWVLESSEMVAEILEGAGRLGREATESIQSGLYAAVVSGGRMGTLGQPFQEDIEQKEKARDIAAALPEASVAAEFYRALSRSAQASIEASVERDQRLLDSRDW